MIRTILWALGILGILLLVQTTLLSYVVLWGAKPDILWIVFAILATQNGSFGSQIVGFVLGIAIDILTATPLGFHAFQFSLAGYLFGLGTGKVYFDPFIMPAVLGFVATLFPILSGTILTLIFRLGSPWDEYLHWGTLVQAAFNIVIAPVVYWLYGLLKEKLQDPRRGFGV